MGRVLHPKQFAEFFAGIGLVRAGLEPGGWDCAYANDFNPKKKEMYEHHFGPSPEYDLADIWDVDRAVERMPDGITLATASFPCTDLSLAGHWKGLDGEHSSTFFAFLSVLKRLGDRKPPIVMLENVVGFLTSRGGDDFRAACAEIAKLGYWLDAFVLDAKHFVPQSRPRVFLVAVQEHLRDALHHPSKTPRLFVDDQDNWTTNALRPAALAALMNGMSLETGWMRSTLPNPPACSDTLDSVLDDGDDLKWWDREAVERHLAPMQIPSRDRLEELRRSKSIHMGTAYRRTRLGKMRTEVRFDIAGCLRTPRGGSARQIVIRVGKGKVDLRWMSAIEYARLQGIGDFKIKVGEQQAMFGFGDAVCVPAISWIDRHVLSPLAKAHLGRLVRKGAVAVG
jgi:DNA (cytosine-5)-methyltransferase 1